MEPAPPQAQDQQLGVARGPGLRKYIFLGMLLGGLWMSGSGFSVIIYGGIGFLLMLYVQQDQMLYAATPPGVPRRTIHNPPTMRSPEEWGMRFESVMVPTVDNEHIHCWLILQPGEESKSAPTMLYFHGNAGNIGTRLPMFNELYKKSRINILAVDYRGYGDSTGLPTEAGIRLDADAALAYVLQREDLDRSKIFVFGRSLGGAVGIDLAARKAADNTIRGLIVENTFLSVGDLAMHLFSFLNLVKFLVPLLLKSKWESLHIVGKVQCPVMFLVGGMDEMIPGHHMHTLYAAVQPNAKNVFKIFPNGGHNDTPLRAGDAYYETVNGYFASVLS